MLLAIAASLVAAASASAFTAHGSVEQVYVTGLAREAQASLLNASGATVSTQNADSLGGLLFRNVKPGKRLQGSPDLDGETSEPITVHTDAAAPWDPSIYNQSIPDNGYTYLTTRDGTQLSIDVHPPTSPAGEPGVPSEFHFPTLPIPGVPTPSYTPPYPTLIEYSGYGYANPAGPENGIAVLANLMGFAVVDVNMRGTGCSGGAYRLLRTAAESRRLRRDRDDRPPAVGARQQGRACSASPTAGSASCSPRRSSPPDLEAIAPLSTIDATATTLYPGGILNTGFAVAWAEQRQQNAEPASPGHGQAWATKRIEEGDQTCAANQALHGEATNLMDKDQRKLDLQPAGRRPNSIRSRS